MFFTPLPVTNALELINYSKNNLLPDYKVERSPTQTMFGGRSVALFAYWSPVAQLHWYVLATQIRCHTVELVITTHDTKLLDDLVQSVSKISWPIEDTSTDGDNSPACIKDYAREEEVITRVEPVFTEHRFNSVPVRIIIDKTGRVKHIHFLSAFPDQAKAITDALGQWKFRPYLRNGQPVEVETGILFGYAPQSRISATHVPISK
jgi:hypothetical protein